MPVPTTQPQPNHLLLCVLTLLAAVSLPGCGTFDNHPHYKLHFLRMRPDFAGGSVLWQPPVQPAGLLPAVPHQQLPLILCKELHSSINTQQYSISAAQAVSAHL